MNEKIKTTGLIGLLFGFFTVSTILMTNISGYLDVKERLKKYQSIEEVKKVHDKETASTGPVWEYFHKIYFSIGEDIAYKQYRQTQGK